MEKSYQLTQKEVSQLGQLDQERTQALAAIGALSLDMEQARKNLDSAAERQRGFIRQVVSARGVERFENARLQNGAVVVTLPTEPTLMPAPPMESDMPHIERVNGPIIDTKE